MNEFEDLLNSVSPVEPGDVVTAEVLIENYNLAKQCLFFVNFHDIINFVDCRRDSEEAKRGGL